MTVWQAILLGAVQGFAEFLPISSSGHLILMEKLFGISNNILFYSVMLHVGTLIPVLIVQKEEIKGLFTKPFSLLKNLVIATIPGGIAGLILSKLFNLDEVFYVNTYLLGFAFIFTAIVLLVSDRFKDKGYKPINFHTALMMGVGQAVGVIPGISRSGMVMTSGRFSLVNKKDNANFTFLMSIPIILSAVILEGGKSIVNGEIYSVEVIPLIFGVVTAVICGYIAINFMMKLIKKASFKWFSLYLVLLSVITFFV